MLKENFVPKLNPNILKRYEESIEDGVLFLFDIKTENVWMGNKNSNDLLKLINGSNSLKEIYNILIPFYEDFTYGEIKHSFDAVIEDLLERNFIEIL